jgi:hypothetical protein
MDSGGKSPPACKQSGTTGKNKLVGGAINILKNMKVNGKDYPIYEMENKIHV